MKPKLILPITICISFYLGYVMKDAVTQPKTDKLSSSEEPNPNAKCEKTDSSSLSCDKQLEQAQEYYGKAFLLFLANIGFNISPEARTELNQVIANPQEYASSLHGKDQVQPSEKTNELITYSDDFLPRPNFKKYLLDHNGTVEHVDDETLLNDAQKFILKDPALAFARSKLVDKFSNVKKFNGLYAGKLYHFIGKRKNQVHDIEMNIDFSKSDSSEEDLIDGNFTLKLSHDGQVYSNSSGNGGNGNIRIVKNSILVEAGPKNILSFINDDLTTANFYHDQQHVAVARLRKVNK